MQKIKLMKRKVITMIPEKFLIIFILQVFLSVICISRKRKILSYIVELLIPGIVIFIELKVMHNPFNIYEIPVYILTYVLAKIIILLIIQLLKLLSFKIISDCAKNKKKVVFYVKVLGRKHFLKFIKRFRTLKYGPSLKLGTPAMVNKVHKGTGVKFDKKGFPMFKSHFTVKLERKYNKASREVHFYQCGKILYNKALKNKSFAKKFTNYELKVFSKGEVPERFTWHHHQDKGVLQLVDYNIHSKVNHVGGFSIWGKE